MCLESWAQQNIFEIHPQQSAYQYFVSFSCCVVFLCPTALRLLAHSPVDAQLSYSQFLDENSMISKKAYRRSLLRLLLQRTVPSLTCFSKFAEPTALWSWTQCGSKDSVPLLIKCPSALTHSFCFCVALNPILI